MRAAAGLAVLVLTGCVPADPVPPVEPMLRLGAEALHPLGSDLEISLSRAEEGVIPVVTRLVGAPPIAVTDHPSCEGNPIRSYTWPGGLELAFRQGDLVGWRATGAGYETRTGVAIGDPTPLDLAATGGVAFTVQEGRVADLFVGPRCSAGQISG